MGGVGWKWSNNPPFLPSLAGFDLSGTALCDREKVPCSRSSHYQDDTLALLLVWVWETKLAICVTYCCRKSCFEWHINYIKGCICQEINAKAKAKEKEKGLKWDSPLDAATKETLEASWCQGRGLRLSQGHTITICHPGSSHSKLMSISRNSLDGTMLKGSVHPNYKIFSLLTHTFSLGFIWPGLFVHIARQ